MKYTLSILIWLYNSFILLSTSILFRIAPDRSDNSILVNISFRKVKMMCGFVQKKQKETVSVLFVILSF